MLSTELTKRLGIEHPIQCGTMQWLSRAELVGPVAEAGALACIASAINPDPAALREEIDKTRAYTSRPFGVNVSLFPSLSASDIGKLISVVAESGVGILETAGRSPEPYRAQIKEAGLFHIHKCARIRDALKAQSLGVDAISVVGVECGGHPGEAGLGSIVLIPQVVSAVDRPVIGGGGFCDGRTLAAGLAMGAQCINMGTRFIMTKECPGHADLKEFYLKSAAADTMLIMGSLKTPGGCCAPLGAKKWTAWKKMARALKRWPRISPGNWRAKDGPTAARTRGCITRGRWWSAAAICPV